MRCFTLCAAAAVALASSSFAAIPDYQLNLVARAAAGGTALNLPNQSTLSNTNPQINDAGSISFRVATVGSSVNDGIWYGNSFGGGVVFTNPTDSLISSTTSLNNKGETLFSIFDLSPAPGLGVYLNDPGAGTTTFKSSGPAGASAWTLRLNDAARAAGRVAVPGGNAFVQYSADYSSTTTIIADNGVNPTSPYSFIFTPAVARDLSIASVVRVGPAGSQFDASRPDQIRHFAGAGTGSIVVEDKDSNPASPFYTFDNSVAMVNRGDVGGDIAFVARDGVNSADRGVFRTTRGGAVTQIAHAGQSGVNSIEFFAPAINELGQVVFRGTDSQGRSSIFVGDGVNVVRVFGVGDTIQTDLGARTVSFLSGGPDINNLGELVFSAQLNSGGNVIVSATIVPEPLGVSAIFVLAFTALRRRR